MTKNYWLGSVPQEDDFGYPITDVFYDAKTKMGPWATMSEKGWKYNRASPKLGTGYGQKYEKQADGRWLKTEG